LLFEPLGQPRCFILTTLTSVLVLFRPEVDGSTIRHVCSLKTDKTVVRICGNDKREFKLLNPIKFKMTALIDWAVTGGMVQIGILIQ